MDVPVVSDIPSGSAANYVLKLSNASEIGADVAYRLGFLDETNPKGAQLMMDGKEIPALSNVVQGMALGFLAPLGIICIALIGFWLYLIAADFLNGILGKGKKDKGRPTDASS